MLLSAREVADILATLNLVANAALVEIAEPGAPARNGDTEPSPVWAGEVPAFLERKRRARVVGGVQLVEDVDVLRVYDAEGAPTEYVAGADQAATTVVVEDRRGGGTTRSRWTVRGVERDADGTLDSTLLELDDERPDGDQP